MFPKNRCPTHPGIILYKHFLHPLGISQAEFVRHLGGNWTPSKLNEIIKGKRGISLNVALDLSDTFSTTPDFWINLQLNYDLWNAKKQHHKIKPLVFHNDCWENEHTEFEKQA